MQLVFQSRNGSRYVDWSQYALLRDNVQHYLESGPSQTSFTALHAVERAVDGGVAPLPALALRRELQRAWSALASLPLADSAVSLRTRAILCGFGLPPVRATFNARLNGWSLPVEGDAGDPLRKHLETFVESVLALTDGVSTHDRVLVCRVDDTQHSGHGALSR
jgi:hypothetical protein